MREEFTLNVKIYNHFYGYLADKEECTLDDKTKISVVEQVLGDMSWDMSNAIRAYIRYGNIDVMTKNTGLDKKAVRKQVEIATRWMYFPNNIALAIPGFYSNIYGEKTGNSNVHMLSEVDFGFNKRIPNALKKSGIVTREQLYKHLSIGWYYLTTIPGVGTGSRIAILKAIDRWEGKGINGSETN